MHVLAQPSGEAAQPELGRRVERRAHRGRLPAERGHEHDVATAANEHPRQQRPRELDRRSQVHVERAIDLLGREAVDGAAGRKRRVRDEHVDRARALGERGRALGVREVRGQAHGPPAELGADLLQHVLAPGAQEHARAACVECPRDRATNPARGPGEEDGRAVKLHRRDATPPSYPSVRADRTRRPTAAGGGLGLCGADRGRLRRRDCGRRLPRSLRRGPDRRGRAGRARQALHRDGERGPTGAREPSDRARRPCARWPARAPERRPDRGRGLPGDGGFGVPGRADRPWQRGADQFGRPCEHPGPRRHDDPDLLDRGGGPRRAIPPRRPRGAVGNPAHPGLPAHGLRHGAPRGNDGTGVGSLCRALRAPPRRQVLE